MFPCDMNPTTTPSKGPWNNHAHVCYHYHVHYCVAEGLHRSHVTTRQVLLYVCLGFAVPEDTLRGVRRAAVIRVIHHAVNNGKHLISHATYTKHFSKLIKVLEDNPDMVKLLTDKGKTRPPKIFMALMEDGLRRMAQASGCMGRVAMSSPAAWANTSTAKKREVYIGFAK